MKKILGDIWYSYQMEKHVERTEEENKILDVLLTNEKRLRKDLNEQQKAALKAYESSMDDLYCIYETKAFIKGVRFATQYLIEAIYNEDDQKITTL